MRKETKAQFAKKKNIKKQVLKIETLRTIGAKTVGLDVQYNVSVPLYSITVPKVMLSSVFHIPSI